MKKIAIFSFLLLVIIMPKFVDAKTLNDYYNELAKLQSEYNANKSNKDLTEKQINKLNAEINNISNSIEVTRKEIKAAEEEINKSKVEIENKKVETDE